MARYSSTIGKKLPMMVGIGKEFDFTSNFDMPWLFTPGKTELRRKMAAANQIAERPLVYQSRGRTTNSLSEDEIEKYKVSHYVAY